MIMSIANDNNNNDNSINDNNNDYNHNNGNDASNGGGGDGLNGNRPLLSAMRRHNEMRVIDKEDNKVGRSAISSLIAL